MNRYVPLLCALWLALPAGAATPSPVLDAYAGEAAAQAKAYPGPSASAGDRFFHQVRKDWSCATCHTASPLQAGRHAVTGKPIQPLAPAANPARLRDPAKVEKWLKRNCNDTLGRECTAAEKADVVAYLLSLAPGKQP
jgi:hypothetical protein